tara:strand:+ start:1839 stop:2642 length:804 start_codon:yes stop_codon:yes gene_type:complete
MSVSKNSWDVPEDWEREYLDVCLKASKYDALFSNFKSNESFRRILEHANKYQAMECCDNICEIDPKFLTDYPEVWQNDEVGNPIRFVIGNQHTRVTASPTTLQYLYVAASLSYFFGKENISNFKILEIGGGYGGQCKIINDIFSFKEYDIVDLAEVGELQRRYLQEFDLEEKVNIYSPSNYKKNYDYDLVISNYALSEITEPLGTAYVNDLVLPSARGYITCNGDMPHTNLLIEKSPQKINDLVTQRHGNYVLVWNNSSDVQTFGSK